MVKLSSDWRRARSCFSGEGLASSLSVVRADDEGPSSAVVPLFPVVGRPGLGGVVVEDEEEELAEETVVVAERVVLEHALEHDDPADGFENNPEISERLRTFHIV